MRETILIDALKEIIKMDWDNWQSKEIARKALTDWASAPKERLQWAKASERLPEDITATYIFRVIGKPYTARAMCIQYNTVTTPDGSITKIHGYQIETLEWLDESSAPESGGEETKDEIINRLTMENMTHEYNQAEAERFRPEYERQLKEPLEQEIKKLNQYLENYKRDDFVPNKSNSDVTPVANSIEQGWIRVEDRLPEIIKVDVWTTGYDFGTGRKSDVEYRTGIHGTKKKFWAYMRVDSGSNWIDISKSVTHWRLLPAPPNSKQEDKRSSLSKEEGKDEINDYDIKIANLEAKIERLTGLIAEGYELLKPMAGAKAEKLGLDDALLFKWWQKLELKENGLKGEGV